MLTTDGARLLQPVHQPVQGVPEVQAAPVGEAAVRGGRADRVRGEGVERGRDPEHPQARLSRRMHHWCVVLKLNFVLFRFVNRMYFKVIRR